MMPRILHIGLGNFHRAHQAWYTAHAGGHWAITGVVMGNTALRDAMQSDGGYTLGIRGPEGLRTEWIGLHDRLILAREAPDAVVAAFRDPELHVVTLTITEAGYCLAPRTGVLNLDHPEIRSDVAGPPEGAMGLLVHGLAARARARLAPLTVLSCDNIAGNGHKLAAVTRSFASEAGLTLDPDTRFPNTMVDRITPATTPEIAAEIAAITRRPGTAPVMTEAFSEWIIEDDFAGLRPSWERCGAALVEDAAPYEMRKLRLLNGAHSSLAYAGLLAGHIHVHQAFADPALCAGVRALWDEAEITLPPQVRSATAAYRAALEARFAVPEMKHSLAQIAMDGSLKLRERLVPLVLELDRAPQACRTIAAWIAYVHQVHRQGAPLSDPGAREIAALMANAPKLADRCAALTDLLGLKDMPERWHRDLAAEVAGIIG